MTRAVPIELTGAEGNRLVGDLRDGGGRTVLLLHGGGQTRHAWANTAQNLAAQGMRAIAMDLRGHGESDWVPSGSYAFPDFGEDVAAMVRQLRERFGGGVVAVGASLGGIASMAAEARHAPLLDQLVLVYVTPRINPEGVAKILGFMGERVEDGFASLEEAADAVASYLPHRRRPKSLDGLRKNLREGADGRYRWHWDPAFFTGTRSVSVEAQETMAGLNAALPQMRLPILLVRGMQSELVEPEFVEEFVRLAPDATAIDVSGAGHMVAGDRNDVFCDAILGFLTRERV